MTVTAPNIANRLAAVDLGSNSFRLEIGHVDRGQFYRTEYLKETVRQGGGLDEQRNLTPEALDRGWACLARFGERLRGFDPDAVRAVATQTLREARNRDVFLRQGQLLLGFPIDVISGREEARLIYQGVAQSLPASPERRLVIDIGGRSTELILGVGLQAQHMESYRVGSIAWSMRYFADQRWTRRAIEVATIAAKAVLDDALDVFGAPHWDHAYGSAGTVNAAVDVLQANGWPAGVVTREGLTWLTERLIAAQTPDRLRLAGMRDDRRPIMGGGVSVLWALFDLLGIQSLSQAQGGLRHGLIQDMLGEHTDHADLREHSVQRLTDKFQVDQDQARRVERVALQLLAQLRPLDRDGRHERKLAWAARLHEIGARISHSDYHKHGAYILEHCDALGFGEAELQRLSRLVLGHRGKLHKLDWTDADVPLIHSLMALRISVILCHARRDPDVGSLTLSQSVGAIPDCTLTLPSDWSERYPQSALLLEEEAQAWSRTPWPLRLRSA